MSVAVHVRVALRSHIDRTENEQQREPQHGLSQKRDTIQSRSGGEKSTLHSFGTLWVTQCVAFSQNCPLEAFKQTPQLSFFLQPPLPPRLKSNPPNSPRWFSEEVLSDALGVCVLCRLIKYDHS